MAWIFSKLENQASESTILHLKSIFSRYGILDKYIINNDSQFSKLSDNFQGIMFTLTLVLAYRKQEKQLLRKCSDPYKAIYNKWHAKNVPSTTVFSRRLKTDLTVASPLLESANVGMKDIQERLKTHKYEQKLNFDAHAGK